MTQLDDLPTELLLLIFSFLTTELYNLAVLSRRLNELCIPLLLSLHGSYDPNLQRLEFTVFWLKKSTGRKGDGQLPSP